MSYQAIKISLNWKKVKKPSPTNQCVSMSSKNVINLLKRNYTIARIALSCDIL